MKQLVIKNVGPIRQVDIKLNRFNFFIGPQSSGKSTVAKILSSCMWLEKEVLTTLNDKVLADGTAFVRLVESFHKIEGYFEDGSFVQYDTDCISIMYCDKDIKITRKENEDYHREKICYIPSERNIATLPELQGFEFGHTNLRSFLFDWFNAREFFVAGNKTDVLNLGMKYFYDSEQPRQKDRIEQVDGQAYQIALSSASSGLQSLTPLLVMLQYYTDEYFRSYNEKKSFATDTKFKNAVESLLNEFNKNKEKNNFKYEEQPNLAHEVGIKNFIEYLQTQLLSTKILSTFSRLMVPHKTSFIIEEPEQNLYPSTQMDLLDLVRACYALRPDGIEWPLDDEGMPSFRLEKLTEANGIEHTNAHDAMSDVYATIEMAKLIKQKQPKLFQYFFENRGKKEIEKLINTAEMTPLVHVSGMLGNYRGNTTLIAPLAWHPTNKNAVIVGHGFQMRTMLSILAQRYPVQKPMHIKNLDIVKCFVYEKDQEYLSFLRTSGI